MVCSALSGWTNDSIFAAPHSASGMAVYDDQRPRSASRCNRKQMKSQDK